MSLTGALDTVKSKNTTNVVTTVDNKSKHYSLESESAVDMYSSKQYKVNPLLLDDKMLHRIQQAPPSETVHREYNSDIKNNKKEE